MRRVRCELCSAEFTCQGGQGCWCTRVTVSGTRRKEIAVLASDCVCRGCLTKGANQSSLAVGSVAGRDA
ncbi:MAG: cysteine-rich CWC family protein [Nitrososphaerales archaeon]|nr:cysteine-rich CWC family protein [Nitrososphaerales archaeon]